jgi:dihydroorotate dehydrogenase
MAGAAAVGIGSGVHRQGLEIFTEINKGLKNYAFEHGLDNIALLRGAAHV